MYLSQQAQSSATVKLSPKEANALDELRDLVN